MPGSLPALPPRAPVPVPPRDRAARLGRAARVALWSARRPRERYAERARPLRAEPTWVRAADGHEFPLWRLPPVPGAPGEPVVLAAGLASTPLVFDFSEEASLARALRRAGFEVWLLGHRAASPFAGDRPADADPPDLDAAAAQDVPAALARIAERTGAPRVLWVGHSMGGQLLYAHLAWAGAARVAAAVTLCSPVRFPRPRTLARALRIALSLAPPAGRVPTAALARALGPLADGGAAAPSARSTPGPRLRGYLEEGAADVPLALLAQVLRWLEGGRLTDRTGCVDYVAAMAGTPLPVLVVAAEGDALCPPEAALPAADALPGAERHLLGPEYGHIDPLLGARAAAEVHPQLVAFLVRHRARVWEEGRATG